MGDDTDSLLLRKIAGGAEDHDDRVLLQLHGTTEWIVSISTLIDMSSGCSVATLSCAPFAEAREDWRYFAMKWRGRGGGYPYPTDE